MVKLRYAPPHLLFTIFSKQVFRQPKQASKSPGGTGCPLSPEPQASIWSLGFPGVHHHYMPHIYSVSLSINGPIMVAYKAKAQVSQVWWKPSSMSKNTSHHQLSTATVLSRTSARPRLGHLSVLGACQDLTLNLMYSSCWEYRCMLSFTFPWGPLSQHASAKGGHHSAFSVLGIKLMQTLCYSQWTTFPSLPFVSVDNLWTGIKVEEAITFPGASLR